MALYSFAFGLVLVLSFIEPVVKLFTAYGNTVILN